MGQKGQEKDAVYFDFVSQPSRAVVLFVRCASLPVEERPVALRKGQQRSKEYLFMNPLGKVPCLKEADGFVLPESSAILKYLAQKHQVADHWYPSNLRQRARVNAAMDWQHWSARRGAAGQVWNRVLAPMSGQHGSEDIAEGSVSILKQALQDLEGYWLLSTPFMAGDAISIADLLVVMELTQLHMLDGALKGPSMEEQLRPFPRVRKWMQRTQETTEPHFSAVHRMLHKATANAVKWKGGMASQSRL